MADPLEELCRAYLDDKLSAGERIRLESRLSAGDATLLQAMDRVKGHFPKDKITAEPRQPRQSEPAPKPLWTHPPVEQPLEEEPKKKVEPDSSNLSSEETSDRVKQYLARGSAVLAIVAIIYASWLQWQLVVSNQKLERAQKALEQLAAKNELVTDRSFINQFELERLKAALTADQGKLIQIAADKKSSFKKAFLMVDYSTNRTLAMVRADSLPPGMKLTFWVENRDYDVNLLGVITKINPDSVYTDFNGSAFIHSRYLEVHLQKDEKFKSGNKIARVKLP